MARLAVSAASLAALKSWAYRSFRASASSSWAVRSRTVSSSASAWPRILLLRLVQVRALLLEQTLGLLARAAFARRALAEAV